VRSLQHSLRGRRSLAVCLSLAFGPYLLNIKEIEESSEVRELLNKDIQLVDFTVRWNSDEDGRLRLVSPREAVNGTKGGAV
jgi:hypothetical protein